MFPCACGGSLIGKDGIHSHSPSSCTTVQTNDTKQDNKP